MKIGNVEVEQGVLLAPMEDVSDLHGLVWEDAQEIAQQLGLRLKIAPPNKRTDGIVKEQRTKAGTQVRPNTEITVTLLLPDFAAEKITAKTLPDVRGMSVRRALTLLHAAGVKTKVIGEGGTVTRQEFRDGKEPLCIIDCGKE